MTTLGTAAILAAALAAPPTTSAPAPTGTPALCPTPKRVAFDGTWTLPPAKACAIQIGPRAAPPEVYAAERLARDLRRRFGLAVEVVRADVLPPRKALVFVLGTKAGNPVAAGVADRRKLPLDALSLGGKAYAEADRAGLDGYVIDTLEAADTKVALVAGVNGRAVVYGADTLFQLLRPSAEGVALARASIRDWASIPWRGSVSSLTPTAEDDPEHDARIRARLNFTDTRYPGGLWLYPGKLSKEVTEAMSRSVAAAHRRGMLVYAHMISSAGRGRTTERVAADFETMLDLGADGMWIGYDDAGAGADPAERANRLIALATARGLSGRRIGHTPPQGAARDDGKLITGTYHRLGGADAGHAHFIKQVPAMAEALYWITQPPSEARHRAAKAVGLAEGKYAWWHNWPRYKPGLLHTSYGGSSLRAKQAPAYYGLVPLSVGWGRPSPSRLRQAARQLSGVWLNACTGGKQVTYVESVLGLWGWSPETYDWASVQRRIYGFVFGPGQVDAARGFDACLARLEGMLRKIGRRGPGVLARKADQPAAQKLLEEMDALLGPIEAKAPAASMLEPGRLRRLYLEPMRATVESGREAVAVCYPEVTRAELDKKMISLLADDRRAEAEKLLAEVTGKVRADVAGIKERLGRHDEVAKFVEGWKARLSGMAYWDAALERHRAERARKAAEEARRRERNVRQIGSQFEALVRGDYAERLAAMARPPAGKPLVELDARDWSWAPDPPPCDGPWGIGRLRTEAGACVAVAYPSKTGSGAGWFAEARAEAEVPAHSGRLVLDAFVTDTYDGKTSGYWFAQLWVGDRKVWETDIAGARAGDEWVRVDMTDPAKASEKLRLRFRVFGKRGVSNFGVVTFLGPVRLRAAGGPSGP